MSKIRTITLSDRPPVKVNEDNWPLLAIASDEEHDGQVRSQADRTSAWSIRVRQQKDGRAIVYAIYEYETAYQGERSMVARHGVMLPAGSDVAAICAAIKEVSGRMAGCEHKGEDASRWAQLADECIADMPAEELA